MPETGRVILSDVRDPRLITIRRGGSLEDDDHHRLAVWAATCAAPGTVESIRTTSISPTACTMLSAPPEDA